MNRAVRDLYEEAAELPADDRVELVDLLLETLTADTETVEEAWAAEIGRRMAEYRAGRARTVSWEELRSHLHRADR
jgi:putative addiction module component (TIGR02574 family)